MRSIDFSKVKKVVVVGTSSSGKTTLGSIISKIIKCPHKDLDDVYWLPNWTKRSDLEAEKMLSGFVLNPSWVITGNYSSVSEKHVWPNADLIVWLDYPFAMILKRALKRSFRRITKKISVCQGNYETWRLFFSRYSIIWWILKTYHRRKKKYGELFIKKRCYPMVRLKNQTQTNELIKVFQKKAEG